MSRTATIGGVASNPATGALSDATQAIHPECLYAIVDMTVDSTTVCAGPAILFGAYVSVVLSAHTNVIKDGSTAVLNIIPSLAAGTNLAFPGVRFETSLIVDPDNSATGTLIVFYRPI